MNTGERVSFAIAPSDTWAEWRRFHEANDMPLSGCLVNPYQPIVEEHQETFADVWWDAGMRSLQDGTNFEVLAGQHCDLPKPIGLWEKPD